MHDEQKSLTHIYNNILVLQKSKKNLSQKKKTLYFGRQKFDTYLNYLIFRRTAETCDQDDWVNSVETESAARAARPLWAY